MSAVFTIYCCPHTYKNCQDARIADAYVAGDDCCCRYIKLRLFYNGRLLQLGFNPVELSFYHSPLLV